MSARLPHSPTTVGTECCCTPISVFTLKRKVKDVDNLTAVLRCDVPCRHINKYLRWRVMIQLLFSDGKMWHLQVWPWLLTIGLKICRQTSYVNISISLAKMALPGPTIHSRSISCRKYGCTDEPMRCIVTLQLELCKNYVTLRRIY